jgi:hypothetical protein
MGRLRFNFARQPACRARGGPGRSPGLPFESRVLVTSRPVKNVEEFRERLARELTAENVTHVRVLDALLPATEVANNAIEFGSRVVVMLG